MLKAYRKDNGNEVRRGDQVRDFKGEEGTFQYATRAPDGSRTGKVMVSGRETYMTVWDLEVREVRNEPPDEMRRDAEAMAARFQAAGINAGAGLGGSVVIYASDHQAAAILAYLGDILIIERQLDSGEIGEH